MHTLETRKLDGCKITLPHERPLATARRLRGALHFSFLLRSSIEEGHSKKFLGSVPTDKSNVI